MDKHDKPFDTYHENLMNISTAITNAGGAFESILSREISLKEFLTICAKNNIMIDAAWAGPQSSDAPSTVRYRENARYREKIDRNTVGDVLTTEEFKSMVKGGALIDYDGFGHPAKNHMMAGGIEIKPSKLEKIPKDATHIVWYNR